MLRINKLISHLSESGVDESTLRQEKAIQQAKLKLSVSTERLRMIQLEFLSEMIVGLKTLGGATIRMLPSYVYQKKTSHISGTYYALDLGGTNFRVLQITIADGKVTDTKAQKFTIPKKDMEGTAEGLFGFIADSVSRVVAPGTTGNLGFTFSFPVQQNNIASGNLITWTKGFTTHGVEGQDVVQLLQQALDKKGVKLTISALCNDTVGTLVTEYFSDDKAAVGVILGTGANACYWEKVRNIPKFYNNLSESERKSVGDELMCINMECGNFDSWKHSALPVTQFDQVVDIASPNPGQQQYEKMISGMYLGDLCRLVFLHLQLSKVFPPLTCFSARNSFETRQLSLYLADQSHDLSDVNKDLFEKYGLKLNLRQRQVMKEVCRLVALRSARLAAAGIATVVTKMGVPKATISIDGSVFEKTPGYKKMMEDCLDELFDSKQHNIQLVHTKDGSGVGAGLIAALECN